MTTTQAIVESMGWKLIPHAYEFNGMHHWGYVDKNGSLICTKSFDPQNDISHAKLLQARLVEDGWIIEITNYIASPKFCAVAFVGPGDVRRVIAEASTEPAAIVSLYCKIKRIEVKE